MHGYEFNPARLARREAQPALMRLHRALSRLSGVLVVMNTGAHPDDEQSGLLAWFRFGLGHRIVIAGSTRGEGGQNALGPERGGLLGLVRSREMEAAARVLDADLAWLGFGPSDPVHDFGFSKDGDATLARWGGADLVTGRLALAYRRWRPDVVIPTFLDVPGQHGHHRAMTRAAEAAIALAADPAALGGSNLPAWRVGHYYLPAWGGGGGTYDDALPPPPATLRVEAGAVEAASGVSYDEIGEYARRYHATQGMGHWPVVPQRVWELHRREGAETRLAEGVPATLTELALVAGGIRADLEEAAGDVARAQTSLTDTAAVMAALARADAAIERAEAGAEPEFRAAHGHRLARKRREIGVALAIAAGVAPILSVAPAVAVPGGDLHLRIGRAETTGDLSARITPMIEGLAPQDGLALDPSGADLRIGLPADLPIPDPFREDYDVLGGNGPVQARLEMVIAGRVVTLDLDPEEPVQILPRARVSVQPGAILRRLGDTADLTVRIGGADGAGMDLPPGWLAEMGADGSTRLRLPSDLAPGLLTLPVLVEGRAAQAAATAAYPHTGPVTLLTPAALRVLTLDLALPEGARVAYVGAGDSVGRWLQVMGFDVELLDEIPADEDFSRFTTVVVGVVAFGSRPDLAAATARLHRFVEGGGHLVTLYQRPDQGWDAAATPPLPLRIGTPSLRWRTTDPTAPVRILVPDHPILTGPNVISAADFEGWDKERGLYFAADRDPAYVPLLAMSDAGEAALDGALVSARVGRGRHSHVALVLHHQMDRLVPGAFRLMANLVQPA